MKRKNIIAFSVALMAIGAFTSCSDEFLQDKPITSVTQLHPKDDIRVTLADGYVTATVKEAHKDGRITKKL